MRRRGAQGPAPLLVAGLAGAFAALWTWTAPGDVAVWPARAADAAVAVHVLDNGFHTDLALPRAALEGRQGPLGEAVRALPPGDWILVGWGDARFYVDQSPIESRLPDGFRAFFFPDNPSVVMLDPVVGEPGDAEDRLELSPAGFARMVGHIETSLALTHGRPRLAAARPGDDARFFASREHFWIGHLCNHWTAGALNAAGLPTQPFRAITSAGVMAVLGRGPRVDRPPPAD